MNLVVSFSDVLLEIIEYKKLKAQDRLQSEISRLFVPNFCFERLCSDNVLPKPAPGKKLMLLFAPAHQRSAWIYPNYLNICLGNSSSI